MNKDDSVCSRVSAVVRVPAVASDLAQYIAEFRARCHVIDAASINDVALIRALVLILASKYIDAVKVIRESSNCSLADAKRVMDRIRVSWSEGHLTLV